MIIDITTMLLLVLFCLPGLTVAQVPKINVGKTVGNSTVEWSKQNKVSLSNDAQDEIKTKFADNQNFLLQKFNARRLPTEQQISMLTSFTNDYLYDLLNK